MEINEIKAKISCNDKDVKQAIFYIINNVKRSWKILLIIVIILTVLVIYGITNGFENYLYGLILLCLALIVVFYFIFNKKPINSYIEFYRKRKESIYLFSEKGLQIAGDDGEKLFDWSLFIAAYDTPSAFILSDAKMIYYIFPKRCFDNISDIEQVKKLLVDKIKNFRII